MSPQQELLVRLHQLWIVSRCKCFMRRSKSATHLDCLQLDSWVVEELEDCCQPPPPSVAPSMVDSIVYAESLDSLQPESAQRTTTSLWK